MQISVTLGSLRMASPLSSPRGSNSGMTMNSPSSALLSPRSPTCPGETRQSQPRGGRRIAAGASSPNNGGCTTEVELVSNEGRDYYCVLGIPREASQEDVRHAYRRLALRYHPDVLPLHRLEMATKCFAAINEAYDTLCDPHKRKVYDHLLRPARSPSYAVGSSSMGRCRGRNWETDQCWC